MFFIFKLKMSELRELKELAKNKNDIDNNQYFKLLKQIPSVEKFLLSQECFITAVANWSRILCFMLTIVPNDIDRSVIVNNLYDEYGNGDLKKSHVNTFKALLQSLGYEKEILICNKNLPSYEIVKRFNESINGISIIKNWIYTVAMLAMIEYTYIDISRNIHQYLINFLPKDEINHYSAHEIIDETHADDLFSLLIPYINSNNEDILEGINTGYKCFNELYSDLAKFLI